jgi:hypothetical protein
VNEIGTFSLIAEASVNVAALLPRPMTGSAGEFVSQSTEASQIKFLLATAPLLARRYRDEDEDDDDAEDDFDEDEFDDDEFDDDDDDFEDDDEFEEESLDEIEEDDLDDDDDDR